MSFAPASPPLLKHCKAKHSISGIAFAPDGASVLVLAESAKGPRLDRLAWPSLTLLGGALVHASAFALSADGARAAINASQVVDKTGAWSPAHAGIVDVESGAVVRALPNLPHVIHGVALSHDGTRIAVGEYERVFVYDARSGALLHALTGLSRVVAGVAFSPDDRVLVTRCYGDVGLWSVSTGERIATLETGDDSRAPVAFLPDGRVVSLYDKGTLALWSPDATAPIARAKIDSPCEYLGVADETIVTCGWNHGIRTWSLALAPVDVIEKFGDEKRGLAVSPDGTAIVVALEQTLLSFSSRALPKASAPLAGPVPSQRIKSAHALALTSLAQLDAMIASTSWLAHVGAAGALADKGAKVLGALADWPTAEVDKFGALFTLPEELLDAVALVCKADGDDRALAEGKRRYDTVWSRAAKTVKASGDDPHLDAASAAALGAASTVEVAAAWLARGWPLPQDLQILLAFYADGRWPCGFVSTPREGRRTALLVC